MFMVQFPTYNTFCANVLIYFIFTLLQNASLWCINCFRKMNWNKVWQTLDSSRVHSWLSQRRYLGDRLQSLPGEAQHCCGWYFSVYASALAMLDQSNGDSQSRSSHPHRELIHYLEPFQVLHSRIPEFCYNFGCSSPVRILFQQTLGLKELCLLQVQGTLAE